MASLDLLMAVCYSLSWAVASSGLILLNKYILSNLDFHYPLTLSSLGMGFSSLAAAFLVHGLKTHPLKEAKITRDFYTRRILPLGFLMAATLGFGNLAYLYLSVSFIQILKAATPVLTMLVLVAARLEKPSTPVTVAVSIIAVGTAIASWGELAFSVLGFVIMLTSECCEACKLAAIQYLLGNMKLGLIEGMYYFTPAGFVWMVFFILPLELSRMRDENAMGIVLANPMAFILAATLGFFVNLLSYGVIQTTSSLTFKVLGQLKNVGVVGISTVLFGNLVSGIQAFGYTVSIVGFFLYNKAKGGPQAVQALAADKADGPAEDGEGKKRDSMLVRTSASAGHVRNGSSSDIDGEKV